MIRLLDVYGVPCTTVNDIEKNRIQIELFMCGTGTAKEEKINNIDFREIG